MLLLNNEYATSGNRMAEVPPASISRAQNAPISLAARASPQTPLGSLQRSLRPPSRITAYRGPISKGRGVEGGEGVGDGSRGEGRGKEGEGRPPKLKLGPQHYFPDAGATRRWY